MNNALRVGLVFFVALILTITPLPSYLSVFRPSWALIAFLYIELFVSSRFHLGYVIGVGLLLDVLLATVVGEHAFALLVATFMASGLVRRFHLFSQLQQMLYVGLFAVGYFLTLYVIDSFQNLYSNFFAVFTRAFVTMIIWPWVGLLLDWLFFDYLSQASEQNSRKF